MSSPCGPRCDFHFIWERSCYCSFDTRNPLLSQFSVIMDCHMCALFKQTIIARILSCCNFTVPWTLGLRQVSLVHSSPSISSLAGVSPVVVCGVFLYVKRKFARLLFSEVWSIFEARKDCLRVFNSFSASPFVRGWYGAKVVCLIPLYCMTWRKHSERNWGSLSETSWSGKLF